VTRTRRRERGLTERAPQSVWPGISGGRFEPLTHHEAELIHTTALDFLERLGYAGAIPSMVELVTGAGGWQDEAGRLHFPRGLVEDVIARAPHSLHLASQDGLRDLDVGGGRLYTGTAGAAPLILEFGTDITRSTTIADVYDIGRLIDTLDHIHFYWRTVVARDMPTWADMDLNTLYAALSSTTKHVTTSFVDAAGVANGVALLDHVLGGDGEHRKRPVASIACTHTEGPLRLAEDPCRVLEAGIRAGMPVGVLSMPQAGATGPVTLAGTVAMTVADCLAGLVFAYLIDPACRIHMALFPFVTDLRTGAMTAGSGEQAIMAAACAQMLRFYDLPGSVAAGMTDAKVPDAQSGAEKALTAALAAHAGASMIVEAAGMQASLLSTSFEGYVIDNDVLAAVQRSVRGLEVSDETLGFETVSDVVHGEGHFLGRPETLARMRTDFVYPGVGDRQPPNSWEEAGAVDVRARAQQRVREVLASHYPEHISEALDQEIRGAFSVLIPRAAMQFGNGRW